jgi:eukaryotic-like serine/threonine-protein kinase
MSDLDHASPLGPPADRTPGPDTLELKASLEARLFDTVGEPRRFGRYRVLDRIGRGAMATVYRATDPDLDRQIAVKVLRPRVSTEVMRARMLREARTMARLSHPNVVAVLEVGREADDLYVAMEYVGGGTLQTWCERNRVGAAGRFECALELSVQALRGLAAAHAAGFVHRDLKPCNLLVGEDGRLRIADFGLARSERVIDSAADFLPTEASAEDHESSGATERPLLTATGLVVGTPAYMAPEQFDGHADARSDQFSWCVTFYEVFFGTRPFVADTALGIRAEILAQRVREPPLGTLVPGWVRPLLLRGLAVDPARRWPDVAALLVAIERRRRPRRWPWLLAVAGAGALAALAARSEAPQLAVAACTDDREQLDRVWGPDARAAIETAFTRASVAYGPATWNRARARMDALGEAWTGARLEACRQTRDRNPEVAAAGRRQTACLDRALGSFAFVAETLGDTQRPTVEHAMPILLALQDRVECAHDDTAVDEAIDGEALSELDRASLLDEARRGPEAIEILEPLAERLPASSHLRAQALQIRADVHLGLGAAGRDTAIGAANDALDAAETTGDPVLLVAAWRTLARAESAYGDIERAGFAIARARNLAALPQVDELERARVDWADAVHLEARGQLVEAAARYRDAIARHRELHADRVGLAFLLMDASAPLLLAGSPDEAVGAIDDAVEICEELLGPEHPETSLALVRAAQLHVQIGRPGVLDKLERAEKILAANPQFHPEALVDVRMTRADVLLRSRRNEEALVAIDGAIETFETSSRPSNPYRIALELFRGNILLALNRPQTVIDDARAILERFVGVEGPMARAHAELRTKVAEAEAMLGHAGNARDELAKARAVLDGVYDPATVPGFNYRVRMAEIVSRIGDHREALAILDDLHGRATDELPPIEHAQMWLVRAEAHRAAGDRPAALAALDRARPFVDADDPEMAGELAEAEARLGVD